MGHDHELVLVDYGSTDGLSDWVWKNFKTSLEEEKLVFFEVKNEVRWNVSRAKNLAHRLSKGDYLFNLDADNFVSAKDVVYLQKVKQANVACWQWSGSMIDGSYGRIGTSKHVFEELGGYDETMLAMGAQDYDLLKRIAKVQKIVRLPAPALLAIQNNDVNKMSELKAYDANDKDAKRDYNIFNSINSKMSEIKLLYEGPKRMGGGFSYKGILNGRRVTLNGFNEMSFDV